jgi:hypothetical protein
MKKLKGKKKSVLIAIISLVILAGILLLTVSVTSGTERSNNKLGKTHVTYNIFLTPTSTIIPPKVLPKLPLQPPIYKKYSLFEINTNATAPLALGTLMAPLYSTIPNEYEVTSFSYVVTRWKDIPVSFFADDPLDDPEGYSAAQIATELKNHDLTTHAEHSVRININTIVVILYATGYFYTEPGGMGVAQNPTGCGGDVVPSTEGTIASCAPINHTYLGIACVGIGGCPTLGTGNYSFNLGELGKVITIPKSQWRVWGYEG